MVYKIIGADDVTGALPPKVRNNIAAVYATKDELTASQGKSAYQSWLDQGNTGTEADFINSLKGADGRSAYQVATDNGFVGTETDWLNSLKGADGANGISAYQVAVNNGFVGTEAEWIASLEGPAGLDGTDGANGSSAYQVAVNNGFVGTEAEWVASLEGDPGDSAYQVWLANGNTGTEADFLAAIKGDKGDMGTGLEITGSVPTRTDLDTLSPAPVKDDAYVTLDTGLLYIYDGTNWSAGIPFKGDKGDPGTDGISAYQVARNNGFTGTETEWLNSLVGADGVNGKSAYQSWLDAGNTGTEADFLASLKGEPGTNGVDGDSAYQIWLNLGNTGTEADFLASLKGAKGDTGASATITAGATTTGTAGTPAAVTNTGTSSAAVFDFTIPAGPKGDTGPGVPLGGTAGQVLAKATATDLDTAWIDASTGTGTGTGSTAQALAARLLPGRYVSWLTPDAPTAQVSTTALMTGGVSVPYSVITSPAGNQNLTMYRRSEGMQPAEFYFDGDEFQIMFTSLNGYGTDTQVWVDGHPVSETPLHNASLTANVNGYLHMKWTSARHRHIRIVNHGGALREIKVRDLSQQLLPSEGIPTVGIVTDSFGGQTNYAGMFETLTEWMDRRLNVNLLRSVYGGTGYAAGGTNIYSAQGRRDRLKRHGVLDAVVFFGSINDPADALDADLTAAFNNTWDAYAADHPDAPLVVFGVQPASATTTLTASNHHRNHLMYLAAQSHPAVVAFVDMLGTAKTGTVPPAWDMNVTYAGGDMVTHLGSVFRTYFDDPAQTFSGNLPPTTSPHHWKRTSWVFTGTGYLGAAANNGNRDFLLGGDNVHPTAKGGYAFGNLMSDALVKVLSSTEPFTYFNV